MTLNPPSFRLSLLCAAAEYLDEGRAPSAIRTLETLWKNTGSPQVQGWLRQIADGHERIVVTELWDEVRLLRRSQPKAW